MLILFRFKNFRSFPDETFLDMRAVSYKEHPGHLAINDNKKILKTLAVYGANASGKTNLLFAMAHFHRFVSRQMFPETILYEDRFLFMPQMNLFDELSPFWSSAAEQMPTEMEMVFSCSGHTYEYGFSIINRTVIKERFTADHHLVFTRENRQLSFGRLYNKILRTKADIPVRENRLFCSVLSSMELAEISNIMQPFETFFTSQINYYADFFEQARHKDTIYSYMHMFTLVENRPALDFGLKNLNRFGIPIEDFILDHGIPKMGYRVRSRKTGEEYIHYTDLQEVSEGTIKYLTLFEQIYTVFQKGGLLLIDNISNNFHPSVTKYVVDLFQEKHNQNAQLIFTTYDISILNNQQFRRDEVALVDMDEYHESRLYTLADIKVRSDASFSKDYLLGKYGGVPLLRDEPADSVD